MASIVKNLTYRLMEKVKGYKNRANDLIVFPNSLSKEIVFYFGGDIQDLPERMSVSKTSREYQCWNLISTGEILHRRFQNSTIVIIRPNEMKDGSFSRYSNFLPSTNEYGDPLDYNTKDYFALHHLRSLNEQIFDDEKKSTSNITLVGFSKGCVVLNQILSELTAFRLENSTDQLSQFISRFQRIIWLDGGHNNGRQVMIWPTDENLLETLSFYNIEIELYVTPFQINSSNPHKKYHTEQYERLSKYLLLSTNKINYKNQLLFSDQTPSINKHFELLTRF